MFVAATTGQGDEPDNMKVECCTQIAITIGVCISYIVCICVVVMFLVTEFLAVFTEEEFATQFITVSTDGSTGLRRLVLSEVSTSLSLVL